MLFSAISVKKKSSSIQDLLLFIILINHSKVCGQLRDLKFFCDHCNYKCNFKNNLVEHITVKNLPREPNL